MLPCRLAVREEHWFQIHKYETAFLKRALRMVPAQALVMIIRYFQFHSQCLWYQHMNVQKKNQDKVIRVYLSVYIISRPKEINFLLNLFLDQFIHVGNTFWLHSLHLLFPPHLQGPLPLNPLLGFHQTIHMPVNLWSTKLHFSAPCLSITKTKDSLDSS